MSEEASLDEFIGEESAFSTEQWETHSLGDLAEYQNGNAFSKSEWGDTGYPIIRIQNLTGEQDEFNYYHGELEERYQVNRGDTLLSWSATIDLFQWQGPKSALNQHIFRVDSSDLVNNTFYRFKLEHLLPRLEALSHGSTMKHVRKADLVNVDTEIPTFEEQRKIATVLYTVGQAIQKTEGIIEQTENLKEGIIQKNIINKIPKAPSPTELGEVPNNWEKMSLEDAASENEDSLVEGPFGSSLKAEEFVDDGYARVIQLQNVRNGEYDDSNIRYVTEEKHGELERHSAKPGDLFIAKMASPVARTCILPDDYGDYMLGCADVVKLEPSEEFIDEFVMYAMNSYPVWKQAAAHIRGSGRLRVNLNQLKGIDLPRPPIEEQRRIVVLY